MTITALVDYSNPRSLGSWLRRRRAQKLRDLLWRIQSLRGAVRILDVGGRVVYWENIIGRDELSRLRATITLVNLPGEAGEVSQSDPIFKSIVGDALKLPDLASPDFDLAHANSVIEHVGNWAQIEQFAAILRSAAFYYCQTPYFWFPIEPHTLTPFFHWLPESVRAAILLRFGRPNFPKSQNMAHAMHDVESIKLLSKQQFVALFPDAQISFEWFGLPKSLIAVKGGI